VPSCASAACHSALTHGAGLDLESPGLPGRLAGAPSTEGEGLIVDTSAPEKSLLYTKLDETPAVGARMPIGGDAVASDTRACVLGWLVSGNGS
jgi:hypothetical protein